MLGLCVASCRAQTDPDWEQVFIVDRVGHGQVFWPNKRLNEFKHYAKGEFVFLLDDDCMLNNPTFVAEMKKAVEQSPDVDIVMVRSMRPQKTPHLMPHQNCWGHRGSLHMAVNGLTYVMKRELYQSCVKDFKGGSGADRIMQSMLRTNPEMVWVDQVFSETQQLGRGTKFEVGKGNWWEEFAAKHNITRLENDIWHLRG